MNQKPTRIETFDPKTAEKARKGSRDEDIRTITGWRRSLRGNRRPQGSKGSHGARSEEEGHRETFPSREGEPTWKGFPVFYDHFGGHLYDLFERWMRG